MSTAYNKESNILLAEDDDDDFLIFSLAIKDLPVKVMLTRAANGDILMKILDESVPDLLFLDLLMPCKDGRTCIREIRANARYDALPIIVYSSLRHIESIEFCYREGSNLFVIKPTSMNELREVLQRILAIDWNNMMYYPPLSEFVMNA